MGWTDGSRNPLGPLGGPACTRQTGYRNVLYLDSWTAAQPPDSPRPPDGYRRAAPRNIGAGPGARGSQPKPGRDVKPWQSGLTSIDARRCWSPILQKNRSVYAR